MSKNTSVSLGPHFQDFIETQVAQGRYGSASDVIRAGLRLLEEHETKLEALRTPWPKARRAGSPKSSTSRTSCRKSMTNRRKAAA